MLKYIENHPYKTVIGFILAVIGIILAVVFWRFPLPATTNNNGNSNNTINSTSVFDLVEKISFEKSTLARQNKLAEYYNYPIEDKGFIIDVERGLGSQDKYLVAKIVKNLEKNEYGRYIALSIECKFSEEWNKTLLATDFSKEIKFTGTIPNKDNIYNLVRSSIDYDSIILEVDNCAIVN